MVGTNKKTRIMLATVMVVLAIIALIIGIILITKLNKQKELEDSLPEPMETERTVIDGVQEVTIRNNFYVVQSCINKFYTQYSYMFKDPTEGYLLESNLTEEEKQEIIKLRKEILYSLMDEEYLTYKGITSENIMSKFPEVGDITINIQNMYVMQKNDRIFTYFVYGTQRDSSNLEVTDFSIMVKIDMVNKTFKILPGDYLQNHYKDLTIGQYIEVQDEEIKNDTYNIFLYENIGEDEYIEDLFLHFKNSIRYSKEQSYKLIEEEYSQQCFENQDEYLEFINENYIKFTTARLDQYGKTKKTSYTEYIFKDKNGNYYIFKETAPFRYTVSLDNYVVPTDEFINEYNASSEKEKVILNIKKFFKGIDDKNYGYAYRVLSESFRSNKYPTKNDFTNFAKQNFFEKNEVEYISYEKQNNLYIFKIQITDATGQNLEEREYNMIVKLNSGVDFEMSFGK